MKKPLVMALIMGIIIGTSLSASAQTETARIPQEVQEYAEGKAFEQFLNAAPVLGFPETVKFSELVLGEGFPVYRIKGDLSSDKLEELLIEPEKWTYFIVLPNGDTLAQIEVFRSIQGDLTSSGGGITAKYGECVNKMRELIRKSNGEGDLKLISYGGGSQQLLYYSFNGDERVLDFSMVIYSDIKLDDITDYRQLPTGREAIQGLKNAQEYIRQEKEKNGGQELYGGTDLQLSLHEYTPAPNNSWIIVAVAAPLLVVGALFLWGRKKKAGTASVKA